MQLAPAPQSCLISGVTSKWCMVSVAPINLCRRAPFCSEHSPWPQHRNRAQGMHPHAKSEMFVAYIACTCVPQEHPRERCRRGRTDAFVVEASCEGQNTAQSTAKTVSGPKNQPIPSTRRRCVVLVGTCPFGRLRAGRGVEESLLRCQWLLRHASRATAAVKKRHWMCEEFH